MKHAAAAQMSVDDMQGVNPLYIDLASVVELAARKPERVKPHFEDAMELQLVDEARKCAAGDITQRPSRELVAAALREADRQQWWRDEAEARELTLIAVHESDLQQIDALRTQRAACLRSIAELADFAAEQLGCPSDAATVLACIRSPRIASFAPVVPPHAERASLGRAAGDGQAQPARCGGGE